MLDIIREHWGIFLSASTLTFNIIIVLLAKTYAKREAVDLLELRMSALEHRMDNLPNQNELHELKITLTELKGDIRALSPELQQLKHLTNLLFEKELKDK